MYNKDKEDFQLKWDDIKLFMQYGVLTDATFYDRAKKFMLLKNTDNTYFTIDDYQKQVEILQKNKDDELIILYSSDKESQYLQIVAAKEKGYDVLLMDSPLDMHFVNLLEEKLEKVRFARVDADVIDKLIVKEDAFVSKLSEDQQKELKQLFENMADKEKFTVLLENLNSEDMPINITKPEFMRRFADMQKVTGNDAMFGMGMMKNNLVLNTNHEIFNAILQENDTEKKENTICQLLDLALLSQQMLTGEALSAFVKRSVGILNNN